MIWDLPFSQALAAFAMILTPIYFALLLLAEKRATQHRKPVGNAMLAIMPFSALLLEAVIIFSLHADPARGSPTYFLMISLTAGLLLFSFRSSPSSHRMQVLTLLSVIGFHIALVYSPPSGLNLGERTAAGLALMREGSLDAVHNPVRGAYNPFPMDIGLYCTFSMISSFDFMSPLNGFVLRLFMEVLFDLVIYALVRRVTGSWVAGVLAVFISALSPTLAPTHEARYPAAVLFTAATLALIGAFEGSSYVSNIIIGNVTYAAAILFHPSAAIGAFLPLGVVAVAYLCKKVLNDKVWERLSSSGLFRASAALLITITFARAIYTAGYLEAIVPQLNSFVSTALGYGAPEQAFTPVYDQSVDPINAYAWVSPVAMASAVIIYSFVKRRAVAGVFPLPMYFVGAIFLSLGFLVVVIRAGAFHGAMYPALVFIVPAAAVVAWKTLTSYRALTAVIMVLMVTFAGIAITDPMLWPERYRQTHAGDIFPQMGDYSTSRFLVDVIPTHRTLIVPYEISSSFDYLAIVEGKPTYNRYITSADLMRTEVIAPLTQNKEVLAGMVYIWPYRWFSDGKSCLPGMPVDVLYDDGRHVIFEG